MSFLGSLSSWLVKTLEPYGAPGLMLIAIGDSSFLSLPEVNDAALMALSISNPAQMWKLAAMTVLGSIIGCSLLYTVGRKGGEALLSKRFAADRILKVRGWYAKYGMLAVIVPSLLPPPLPFKIFVLCAGAFGISWFRFVLAVGIGRSIRYFSEGILAVRYGNRAVQLIGENAAWVGVALALVIVAGGLVWAYSRRRSNAAVLLIPLLVALSGTGCIRNSKVPKEQRMEKFYSFTREQALDKLQQMGRRVQSIETPISLEGSTASLKEEFTRTTGPTLAGTLIMQRPNKIFLKGRQVVLSIFEMVSDGKNYQVFINQKDQLYKGREDAPPSKPFPHLGDLSNQFVNLRPKQIMDALMVDVRPLLADPKVRTTTHTHIEGLKRYLIVQFQEDSSAREGRLLEEIWFDLTTEKPDVARRLTYDKAGEIETETRYSGYQGIASDTVRYPAQTSIQFLSTGTLLKFTIDPQQINLNNSTVPQGAFAFDSHPGAKVFTFEPRDATAQK